MQKKIPLRKCVACNERKTKKELIRVVKNKDGEVKVDLTGKINGKGAYICPTKACFEKAKKSDRFSYALETKVTAEIYDRLMEEIKENE